MNITLSLPLRRTVWGPMNNIEDLKRAIAKSGQPFGVDWSGPACDFRKDWPCDKTFYQMLGIQAHNGIDLPCGSGTEVFASHYGRVSEISNDTASGLGVVLFDPVQKIKTIYWHFLTNYKQVGEIVERGELIGLSDNTGYSKGNHLHFGLKLTDENGNTLNKDNSYLGAIDPMPYFEKGGGEEMPEDIEPVTQPVESVPVESAAPRATLFKRVVLRFLRAFVAGGFAALVVQVGSFPHLSTFGDLKTWLITLLIGFIAGGLQAIDKAYRG